MSDQTADMLERVQRPQIVRLETENARLRAQILKAVGMLIEGWPRDAVERVLSSSLTDNKRR